MNTKRVKGLSLLFVFVIGIALGIYQVLQWLSEKDDHVDLSASKEKVLILEHREVVRTAPKEQKMILEKALSNPEVLMDVNNVSFSASSSFSSSISVEVNEIEIPINIAEIKDKYTEAQSSSSSSDVSNSLLEKDVQEVVVRGTRWSYVAHQSLRTDAVSNPESPENRKIRDEMIAKGLERISGMNSGKN